MRFLATQRVMTPLGPTFVPTGLRWNTGGIPPPPPGITEPAERAAVYRVQSRRNPTSDEVARYLDRRGQMGMWFDLARQYRHAAGPVAGWAGTALMGAAMGIAALRSWGAKNTYRRARPYQVDPGVQLLVKDQHGNASYPSGHATSAAAAATVLSILWPLRAQEFRYWANEVGRSRIYGGVHYPSDVAVGLALGEQVGWQLAGWIRR